MNFADFISEYSKTQKREEKKEAGKAIYEMYEQMIDAGFTEEQAMYLLAETIKAIAIASIGGTE